MCVRPPCENCGAKYDACLSACPECGHPNSDPSAGTIFAEIKVKPITQKVHCKICNCDHEVTRYVFE